MTPAQAKAFDACWTRIQKKLGSYNRIAAAATAECGVHVTGPGINGWVKERDMPLDWALVFAHLAEEKVELLVPWARDYLRTAA